MSFFDFRLTGDEELARALEGLPAKLARRLQRTIMAKAARLMVKEIKRAVREAVSSEESTGALFASIGHRVKTSKSGTVYAIIGPQKDVVYSRKQKTKVLARWRAAFERKNLANVKQLTRKPSRYAHLVEKGHRGPHPAPGHAWLYPGFLAARYEVIQLMHAEVGRAIEELARGGTA